MMMLFLFLPLALAKAPISTITSTSWVGGVTIDRTGHFTKTVIEYRYPTPWADTPSGQSSSTSEGQLSKPALRHLRQTVWGSGFLHLNHSYGAPKNTRYYPYEVSVTFKNGSNFTVKYRSHPDFPAPPAFTSLSEAIQDAV